VKKKFGLLILSVVLILSVLAGCSEPTTKIVDEKINVYTTFFPLYDFTRQIGGEHVNVVNLVPAGVEAHDWTPKSRELSDIRKAQVFVYNGAGFEGWVEDFLGSLEKADVPLVIEATKGLDLIEIANSDVKATKDEHAHEDEHGHEHGHADEHAHEKSANADKEATHDHDHGNVDPHVWLSPLQAKEMSKNIFDALVKVDPKHKADYEKNFTAFDAKLDELHKFYKDSLAGTKRKEIVVQHEAYGYLCRDYGLTQKAIMGISPDAEPTAQDMKSISDFVKKHDVKYILFEELVSDKVAKTLADDLNIGTLVFSPVEGLTEEQDKAGETYITMMEKNLTNLVKALQ
jgi:zinc transport system substrate-binding protein